MSIISTCTSSAGVLDRAVAVKRRSKANWILLTRHRVIARSGERAMIMALFFALYMTQKSDTSGIHLILCATAA